MGMLGAQNFFLKMTIDFVIAEKKLMDRGIFNEYETVSRR